MPIDLGKIPYGVWTISTNIEGDAYAVLTEAEDGGGQGWVPYRKLDGSSRWEKMGGWGGVIVALSGTTSEALVIGRKGGPCVAYENKTPKYITNYGIHHVAQGQSGKIVATQHYGGKNHLLMEDTGPEPIRFNTGHIPRIEGHTVALTSNDSVWITNNIEQLWAYDRPSRTWTQHLSGIYWVAVGFDDTVWALSKQGVLRKNGNRWDLYPITNGRTIHAAPDGELLIVTTSNAIVRLDGDRKFSFEHMEIEVMDQAPDDKDLEVDPSVMSDFIPRKH